MTREELRELREKITQEIHEATKVNIAGDYRCGYWDASLNAINEVKSQFAECEKSMFPEESTK